MALYVEAGFQPHVDFLYGLHGETDARAMRKLAVKLGDMGARIHNYTFMPLPGIPFRAQAPGSINEDTQQ